MCESEKGKDQRRMKALERVDIRSDEIEEILGKTPGWFVKWGITVFFAIIVFIFLGAVLLKSPDMIDGRVIIKTNTDTDVSYMAEGFVGLQNSGKIRVGQPVNIKLDNYPYLEYGMLVGKVTQISSDIARKGYTLSIHLPSLQSTQGHTFDQLTYMEGEMSVITNNRSFFHRILSSFIK